MILRRSSQIDMMSEQESQRATGNFAGYVPPVDESDGTDLSRGGASHQQQQNEEEIDISSQQLSIIDQVEKAGGGLMMGKVL